MKINASSQSKIREIENELFNVDFFNANKTVFPEKVFKKKFDKYYFLDSSDWFSSKDEFAKLMSFVKENGETNIYNTVPNFQNINGIEISTEYSYKDYVSQQIFENDADKTLNGIGLRKSPEMFYFGNSKKWAIVFDLTNNIFIVGLENDLINSFEKTFKGQFKNIKEYVEFLERNNGSQLNDRDTIINNYS